MKRISTRDDLVAVALELGVDPEWHEPDNQGVTVQIKGRSFDNTGSWGTTPTGEDVAPPDAEHREITVVLCKDGTPHAEVNLADLFAWATRLRPWL